MDVRKFPLVSDQVDYKELSVIVAQLERCLASQTVGDVVELGCFTGTTSLFIARVLQANGQRRAFHVYDSFEGLPPKTAADASPAGTQFQAGELTASKAVFIKHFKHAGLPLPIIHKCWFAHLSAADLPAQIVFAFLDGDFYTSIRDSLRAIESRLAPHAVIIVDDYQSEALPGARKAVDEWLRDKPFRLHAEQSLAVIRC